MIFQQDVMQCDVLSRIIYISETNVNISKTKRDLYIDLFEKWLPFNYSFICI